MWAKHASLRNAAFSIIALWHIEAAWLTKREKDYYNNWVGWLLKHPYVNCFLSGPLSILIGVLYTYTNLLSLCSNIRILLVIIWCSLSFQLVQSLPGAFRADSGQAAPQLSSRWLRGSAALCSAHTQRREAGNRFCCKGACWSDRTSANSAQQPVWKHLILSGSAAAFGFA